jgi:DNA-binding NarL/FixJ family response regulator
MRVVLVGRAADRLQLRARLPPGVEVVAEHDTPEDARRANDAADAVMSAPTAPESENRGPKPEAGSRNLVEHLTPREAQVLSLMAEGLSNRGIADRLHISDQTVKFHVASIMGKLGTANRVETVRVAVRRGMISL